LEKSAMIAQNTMSVIAAAINDLKCAGNV
jgi:hypothetical protein